MDMNAVAIILQMLLCIIIMILNRKIYISGFGGLFNKAPNKYSLTALGSIACFIYGILIRSFLTPAVVITLFAIVNRITEYLTERFEGEERDAKTPILSEVNAKAKAFVYIVIAFSAIAFVFWMIIEKDIFRALCVVSTVLVSACPIPLFVSAPLALKVGDSVAKKNKILFEDISKLEDTAFCDTVLINKSGIITKGEPVVTDVFSTASLTSSGYSALKVDRSENELIRYAGIIESHSQHPIAKAVTDYAFNHSDIENTEVVGFIRFEGKGLEGKIDGSVIRGGNHGFVSNHAIIPAEIEERAQAFCTMGKTPIYYSKDNMLLGIIAVSDSIKDNSKEGLAELKTMDIKTLMVTGDNEKTAKAIADSVGCDEVISGVLTEEKKETCEKYKGEGNTAFICKDENDADALIINDDVREIASTFRISRITLLNIHHIILGFVLYNIIMIPIAAGCFAFILGHLSPMLGASFMSAASLIFIAYALLPNSTDVHDPGKDKKLRDKVWRRKWKKRSRSNILTISLKS
ncbi:HAD family hydrolase [Butyrivibrio sp. X503]|uniref:heavy metal translocating P-type ATPase n=1 Tax=Butyrivibrio sp. X503 TaxID=2364878 RepID=UPI000EA9FD6D|nr:HAD family hydrolase [Butyrivibrio sp. X503]RKM57136.1 HAD family hydrolase [Butyrivibrio sp. X503]